MHPDFLFHRTFPALTGAGVPFLFITLELGGHLEFVNSQRLPLTVQIKQGFSCMLT